MGYNWWAHYREKQKRQSRTCKARAPPGPWFFSLESRNYHFQQKQAVDQKAILSLFSFYLASLKSVCGRWACKTECVLHTLEAFNSFVFVLISWFNSSRVSTYSNRDWSEFLCSLIDGTFFFFSTLIGYFLLDGLFGCQENVGKNGTKIKNFQFLNSWISKVCSDWLWHSPFFWFVIALFLFCFVIERIYAELYWSDGVIDLV